MLRGSNDGALGTVNATGTCVAADDDDVDVSFEIDVVSALGTVVVTVHTFVSS